MAVIKFINGIEFQSQLIEKMAKAIQEAESDPRFYQRVFDTSDAYWHSRCYVALDAIWEDIHDTLWDRWKEDIDYEKNKKVWRNSMRKSWPETFGTDYEEEI